MIENSRNRDVRIGPLTCPITQSLAHTAHSLTCCALFTSLSGCTHSFAGSLTHSLRTHGRDVFYLSGFKRVLITVGEKKPSSYFELDHVQFYSLYGSKTLEAMDRPSDCPSVQRSGGTDGQPIYQDVKMNHPVISTFVAPCKPLMLSSFRCGRSRKSSKSPTVLRLRISVRCRFVRPPQT